MMPLNDGDATFTGSFTKLGWDEAGNQYQAGFKPPKGEKFVIMLLGTAPKDATDYDLEAALARLGFVWQGVEDTADRIVNGFAILDGMAFSKAEILTQRKDLCDALEELEAIRAFVEPVAQGTKTRREKWLEVIKDLKTAGIPKWLRPRVEQMEREVEKAIQYGGTQRLRDQIADLRTLLEKILPFAEQHLDHELFGGSVKEMEAALELIREARELLK